MALGGTYDVGTASVSNGSTTVTIDGALLVTNNILEGDWFVDPESGRIALIDSITGEEELELSKAWAGTALDGDEYQIIKMSWQRYDPAITQQKIRDLLALLDGANIFYAVTGESPDPAIGEDGDFAIKIESGAPWKFWFMEDGAWVLQGTPVGVQWAGIWDSETEYTVNQIVNRLGSAYLARAINTNVPPEDDSDPEDEDRTWDVFTVGGSKLSFLVWDNGKPTSGEVVCRAFMGEQVEFPVDLAGSYAKASVAATAESVFSIQKNGVEFATITFAAASTDGVLASASGASFAAGDLLTVVAPNPRDDTLSGVAATITGYR